MPVLPKAALQAQANNQIIICELTPDLGHGDALPSVEAIAAAMAPPLVAPPWPESGVNSQMMICLLA